MSFGRLSPLWLLALIVLVLASVSLLFVQFRSRKKDGILGSRWGFRFATLATLTPIFTSVVAIWLFSINHGHPTAQLSKPGELAFVWMMVWLFSYWLHGASALLAVTGVTLDAISHKTNNHNMTRFAYHAVTLCLLLASGYNMVSNFPDA